jgi:hypothetical protein
MRLLFRLVLLTIIATTIGTTAVQSQVFTIGGSSGPNPITTSTTVDRASNPYIGGIGLGNNASRHLFLYRASELKMNGVPNGLIKSIRFNVTGSVLGGAWNSVSGGETRILSVRVRQVSRNTTSLSDFDATNEGTSFPIIFQDNNFDANPTYNGGTGGWQNYVVGQGVDGGVATAGFANGIVWNGDSSLVIEVHTRNNIQRTFSLWSSQLPLLVSNPFPQNNTVVSAGNNFGFTNSRQNPQTSNQSSNMRPVLQLDMQQLGVIDVNPSDSIGARGVLTNIGTSGTLPPVYDENYDSPIADGRSPFMKVQVINGQPYRIRFRIESMGNYTQNPGPAPGAGAGFSVTNGQVIYTTGASTSVPDQYVLWEKTAASNVEVVDIKDLIGAGAANWSRVPDLPAVVNPNPVNFGSGRGFVKLGTPTLGALDLRSVVNGADASEGNIPAGRYRVVAYMEITNVGGVNGVTFRDSLVREFTVAFQNDIAGLRMEVPRAITSADSIAYPRGNALETRSIFANMGLDSIGRYRAYTEVWLVKTGGDSIAFRDSSNWYFKTENNNLRWRNTTVDTVEFSIPGTAINQAGRYVVKTWLQMRDSVTSAPIDQQSSNDTLITQFRVRNTNDVEAILATSLIRPFGTGAVNRPIRPQALFQNNGVNPATSSNVRMIITNASNVEVYNQTSTVTIPTGNGLYSQALATWGNLWVPTVPGAYTVRVISQANLDDNSANNEVTTSINVVAPLSGTYTIGSTVPGPRNFSTLQAAIDELFFRGISENVRFEFTDDNRNANPSSDPYIVGDTNIFAPALDLRSKILGANNNTITFAPHTSIASVPRAAVVRLRSGMGMGMVFGQAYSPLNRNAIQRELPTNANKYYNSFGNFIFDGGNNRSIAFDLEASDSLPNNAGHRSAIYLGRGSQNITIQNCFVSTASSSHKDSLPNLANYTEGKVLLDQPDIRLVQTGPGVPGYTSYTAGIVSRVTMPRSDTNGINLNGMDTLTNSNNKFINNEITNFSYGIVSLGLDYLQKSGGGAWTRYYNTNNIFRNNYIHGCYTGGIVVGNEENAVIEGNRIDTIARPTSDIGWYHVALTDPFFVQLSSPALFDRFTTGIKAGGDTLTGVLNLRIMNNEVSNIASESHATGIHVEQQQTIYASPSTTLPNVAEQTYIANNIVWNIMGANSAMSGSNAHQAIRGGILVSTRREYWNPSQIQAFINPTPQMGGKGYFTERDTIINNTVLSGNDAFSNQSPIFGIGVMQALRPVVMNNAVSVNDATVNSGAQSIYAALHYVGVTPSDTNNGLLSNYNAFFTPVGGSIASFVETDFNSVLLDAYPSNASLNEYKTIRQWRYWTGQDWNSILGDFISDHSFAGSPIRLRIKTSPFPTNSVLNNTGFRLTSLATDIKGQSRGAGNDPFDIGADEFNGVKLANEFEVAEILSPASYKAESGQFNDAEHVMTPLPLALTARIRNTGGSNVASVPVRFRMQIETASSNNTNPPVRTYSTTFVVDTTVIVAINSGESRDVSVALPNFKPLTYADPDASMRAYITPSRFDSSYVGLPLRRKSKMFHSVTPRYQMVVSLPADDYFANNQQSKEIRFFVMKGGLQVIASVTNIGTNTPIGNPGRLNSDSLLRNLDTIGLGFRIDSLRNSNERQDYDELDRSSWEPRGVNYKHYRTMFWAHGDNALSRFERRDIRNFLNNGTQLDKKQFMAASQEWIVRHDERGAAKDKEFMEQFFRADTLGTLLAQRTPRPVGGYEDRPVTGRGLNFSATDTTDITGVAGDPVTAGLLMPAIMRTYTDINSTGIVVPAYRYDVASLPRDTIMGTAYASLTFNAIYLGTDWRHFRKSGAGSNFNRESGVVRLLRGGIDFFDRNGGWIVPVELVNFVATPFAKSVDIRWLTAQEVNSGYFEVERATITDGVRSNFVRLTSVSAAGNSQSAINYGFIDESVVRGNTYIYRLRIVDKDGSFDYSNEQAVAFGSGAEQLWLGDVLPSPFQTSAVVSMMIPTTEMATLRLLDMSGKTVATFINGQTPAGLQQFRIEASSLPSGIYTLVLEQSGVTASKTVQVIR